MQKARSLVISARNALVAVMALAMGGLVWGGGGVTGTGRFSFGEIIDFASVIVNGIEYFTTNANIVINGNANRPESELKIGMVTRVVGTLNADKVTGEASRIEYDADLIGSLDSAPLAGGNGYQFSVYGLGVRTAPDTKFDGVLGAAALAAGDIVEVSGLYDANTNRVLAKFVQRKPAATPLQLNATISNVTPTTFVAGNLTVDYASATLVNLPSTGLANGMRIRMKAGSQAVGGFVVATRVESLGKDSDEGEGLDADMQGVVANLAGGNFNLGNVLVTTDASTLFVNGTAAMLANGAEVEVDGHILGSTLIAAKVSFVAGELASMTGPLVSRSGDVLTLFSASGAQVKVNAQTILNDITGGNKNYTLNDMRPGDRLLVRGVIDETGGVLATRIDRTKPDPAVDITARVGSAAALNLTVLKQLVYTPANLKFKDAKGRTLSVDAFYGQVIGHTLLVKGTMSNGVIVANRADIQP